MAAQQLEHPSSTMMRISGETSFQEMHLRYEWKILNFREMFNTSRVGCILESSRFSFREDQQDQWYLELYPRGDIHKPTYMLMAIKLTQRSYDDMPVDFLSGIVSMNVFIGTRRTIHLDDICIEECYPDNNKHIVLMTLYDLCEAPHEIYPQNVFIINCNIVIKAIIHQQTLMIYPITSQNHIENNISPGFRCERKFTDVVFNVDGVIIHAHKFILSSRSSIFHEIFENQLIDNNRKYVIQITDIKVNVFNQMLKYIYTNNPPSIHDNIDDLIIAADKYCLMELKYICEMMLSDNITIINVANILITAHFSNAEALKIQALNFIEIHYDDVVETDGFHELQCSYDELFNEVYSRITRHRLRCNQ